MDSMLKFEQQWVDQAVVGVLARLGSMLQTDWLETQRPQGCHSAHTVGSVGAACALRSGSTCCSLERDWTPLLALVSW